MRAGHRRIKKMKNPIWRTPVKRSNLKQKSNTNGFGIRNQKCISCEKMFVYLIDGYCLKCKS